MKKMRLFEALGKVDENFIVEASPENKQNTKFKYIRWAKRVVVAASIGLFLVGTIDTLKRLDYMEGASCGAGLGWIVNGNYYYSEPHKGVFQYTPEGENELLLHTYWLDEGWTVNEYGIYYKLGMSVYVCDHETGTRTKLYTSDVVENTHIGFTLTDDGNVIVTNYNKNTEMVYEVLVDGANGSILETVMEKTSYKETNTVYYSDMHLKVGDREITLEPIDEKREIFKVIENDENILPEGFYVTRHYPENYTDILLLDKYKDEKYKTVFAIYPDGTNQVLQFPPHGSYTGNDKFLYYTEVSEGAIGCVDARSGENWLLEIEANEKEYNDMHNVVSDGEYMYTCGPAGGEIALWKLVYDAAGRPVTMKLLDSDIKSEK